MLSVARSICSFEEGLRRQERAADLRERGGIPDTLLLFEFDPVYTLGTNAEPAHLLDPKGVEVVRTDRGGEVTWHGPGQVVGYVVSDLRARGRDLHRFCRDLEEIMLRALRDFGIEGSRREGFTGAWAGHEKIGALGVRVRRSITTHGFALNVSCDLSHYDGIIPCGIFDKGVTSMERVLGRPVPTADVRGRLAAHFAEIFGG